MAIGDGTGDDPIQIVVILTAIVVGIIGGIYGAKWLGFIGFLIGLIAGGVVGAGLGYVLVGAGFVIAALCSIGLIFGLLYLIYAAFIS